MHENSHPVERTIHDRLPWLALILLVPLATAIKISWFGLSIPGADSWNFADLLMRYDAGTLGIADFWAQQGMHRPLFPRLLHFALAWCSHWNIALELAANLFFAALSFGALLRLVQQTTARAALPWLAVVLAFFVFSWSQMSAWVTGGALPVCMGVAALAWGIAFLAASPPGPWAFGAAIACGVVASYAFAPGLGVWIVALPLVAMAPGQPPGRRTLRAVVWAGTGVIVTAVFFGGYEVPGDASLWEFIRSEPMDAIAFALLQLGLPVSGIFIQPAAVFQIFTAAIVLALAPGILGLLLMGALKIVLFRRGQDTLWRMAPWLSLAAFALLGGTFMAMAEPHDYDYATGEEGVGRIIMVANLFWCGLAGLLGVAAEEYRLRDAQTPQYRGMLRGGLALLFLVLIGQTHSSAAAPEEHARGRRLAEEAIRAGHDSEFYLKGTFATIPEFDTKYLPFLRETRRCGFSPEGRKDPARAAVFVDEAARMLAIGADGLALAYLQTALYLDPGHLEALDQLRAFEAAHPPGWNRR